MTCLKISETREMVLDYRLLVFQYNDFLLLKTTYTEINQDKNMGKHIHVVDIF